jgi:hypothetical protein
MPWLFAAGVACVCFAAATLGTFVPLRDASGIEFLFAWSGGVSLALASAGIIAGLATLFALAIRLAARVDIQHRDEARTGRWLAPLTGLGAVALGILPAVPGIGQYATPFGYFFYDLRWWWLLVLGGWTLVRLDAVIGAPVRRRLVRVASWAPASRLLLLDALVASVVVTWAIATTPNLRFIGDLHGDEPKYIRYCELWYQGGGLNISQKAFFTDQRLDAPPRLGRALLGVAHATIEETRAFASDLVHFAANPLGFRWNRSIGGDGFVVGKHGGIYEIYQPGLSVVLFPGYLIDRYLLGTERGYGGEFPGELPMTNVMMLLTYALCGVALFRLLRQALAHDGLAALWAAIGAMTLPTTAFAFQFYPELPAAVIVIALVTYACFAIAPSGRVAILAGGAAAAIGWLHPRFLLVSFCLGLFGVLRTPPDARRRFVMAYVLVLLSVMTFDYRITGSWLPTAVWDAASPGAPINPVAVPLNLIAYGLDRRWGLIPHAPILLLALPGIAVLARTAPRHALLLVLLALALGGPASGHTINAAGGTPGRLVLAVVPLAVWPIAVFVRRFWSSAVVRVTAVMLVVLSLDAGLVYNWTHKKHLGTIRDAGFSGWKPNLAFPLIRADSWWTSAGNFALLMGIILTLVVGAWIAFARTKGRRQPAAPGRARWWVAPAAVAAMILAATVATSATAGWYYDDYLLPEGSADRMAAEGLVDLARCSVCFSSRRRALDWTSLEPNAARGVLLHPEVTGRTVAAHVRVESAPEAVGFGRARVDFGDGASDSWVGVVGERTFEHTYQRPGTYSVVAWLHLRDGSERVDRAAITIKP